MTPKNALLLRSFAPRNDEWRDSGRLLVPIIRLDRAVHLDGQRIAVTILGVAGGDAHPALADAILLDIGLFGALEADADVARQNRFVVIGTAGIDREAVGELL